MIAYNILGLPPYGFPFPSFSFSDLFLFALSSFIIITGLLWYQSNISKGEKSILNDVSEQPLYQSKDILLQERTVNNSLEYIPVKTSVSVFTKIVLAILVFALFVTPLYELLNVEYFI